MNSNTTRRKFLAGSMAAAGAAVLGKTGATGAAAPLTQAASAADKPLPVTKGVVWGMLPKELSIADRMKLARDAGFQNVQTYTEPDQATAEEIKRAAEDAGIIIRDVMNQAHWKYPLSSSDPEVVEKSLEGMRVSLQNAKFWGADSVLLVPAVVNPETRYEDAWSRSVEQIGKLLPLAEELQVVIAIEEVWNRFLLSPIEFRNYVDHFDSPWLKAYFDVGNVLLYGYPEDWIRTLRYRIDKVHLKDFKRDGYQFVNLGDGDLNWPAVREALMAVGYHGPVTVEIRGGDLAYLKDVANRVDRLLING